MKIVRAALSHPADKNSFRMAVALTRWPDGDISYVYSWGLPGGEFAERPGVRMRKSMT